MSFSSSVGEDFSPVIFQNGLVYCSNSINTAVVSIKSEDECLYNILYVEKKDSTNFKTPQLLAPELTTLLNEGPATFSSDGNTIYFARNNLIEGKLKDINKPDNRLGIYSAALNNGVWTNITAFPYNNPEFSLGTPSLSKDGTRLFFASDMPGGYGGTDIYYCDFKNGEWTKPANLGQNVNTATDESYPFICESGRLFFASQGHEGLGGKDIFYTLLKNETWIKPIHLDTDINSEADDYGIVSDKNFEFGYFSSARKNNADIYSFRAIIPHFALCDTIPAFRQCYKFYDEHYVDTLHLEYEWDFGHGIKKKGIAVEQCFETPGKYEAVLTITHHIADTHFSTKDLHKFEIPQPAYINIEYENAPVCGRNVLFKSNLEKTHDSALSVHWNTGKGFQASSTSSVASFNQPGAYNISVGEVKKTQDSGTTEKVCFSKPVQIYSDLQAMTVNLFAPICPNTEKAMLLSENNNQKQQIYRADLYLPAILTGYLSDSISTILRKISVFPVVFDGENQVLPESDSLLNPIFELLNTIPEIELLISFHVPKKGNSKNNQEITDALAKNLYNFYLQKGLDPKKFKYMSYGDNRPINLPNSKDSDQINKRIEFIILNKQKLYTTN